MGVAKVSAASVRFWAASSADLNLYNIQDPGPPYSLVGFPAFSISLTHSETLSVAELLFKVDLGLAFFKLTTRPYALVINRGSAPQFRPLRTVATRWCGPSVCSVHFPIYY
jgi:hypothetical protein